MDRQALAALVAVAERIAVQRQREAARRRQEKVVPITTARKSA